MTQPDEDLTPGDHLTPDERDPEAPEADASEQAALAQPDDAGNDDEPTTVGIEVDEADAAEQARSVGGEDDYR
jgi:hypothetical protein